MKEILQSVERDRQINIEIQKDDSRAINEDN